MPEFTKSRTIKAVAATAVGVILLAGTGGTFARWFDEEIVPAGPLTSGTLELSEPTTTATEATLGDLTVLDEPYEIVPGDVITFTMTTTPTIVGDNMVATLSAQQDAATGPLADFVDFETTIAGGGTGLTEADSGTPIDVTIVATMPFSTGGEPGVGNGTDGQSATLDVNDITLSLVQDDR